MKNILSGIKTIVLLILVGVIFIQNILYKKQPPITPLVQSSIRVEKEYVPVSLNIPELKVNIVRVDTVKDSIKIIVIDTVAAINDYVKKRAYSDTLKDDTIATIIVKDTIQYNAIQSRSFSIRINYQRERPMSLRRFYIGGGLYIGKPVFGAYIDGLYVANNDRAYSIRYDPFNKVVEGSMYWRINFKK